ncbi:AraC-like DNA-binding protein [Aquimarina sp. MAR_2010_214]|uniref:helix-turn-helix domain-containing protein n=1 Tax=Aquimarina sp. MAR_2010_214 TaxID=1250026 RepID=UPI000C7080E7|nr:helix-turn-helix domain-containing protein [Aquimarina sp. MAR_2010_214]PKV53113.1 AraC-like DNA-binding protein [Aquimarina sp. MAR_2010_214]
MKLLVDFVLVGGVIIIAILLLLLIKSKKKQLSQKILTVFFVFLGCVILCFYALLHDIIWLFRICFIPNDITVLVVGPLLLLYIKSLFLKEENLVKNSLPHFIPAALYTVFIAVPTLLYGIFSIDRLSYILSDFIYFFIRIGDLHLMLYLIISLRLLSKYRKLMKSKYSNLTKYDFNWIRIMLQGALCVISIDVMLKIYESFYGDFDWNADFVSVITMIILISFLGYYGVNQSSVLLPDYLLEEDQFTTNKSKNTLPSFKKEEFETLKSKLELILVTNRPYLDEDLTLGKLANQISTTDKKLSMLLNQYMNTTFYDLINTYRINAVKEKIQSDLYDNYNLFGIACECGFKSRTSFNRIFKKETGCSPSVYKKQFS